LVPHGTRTTTLLGHLMIGPWPVPDTTVIVNEHDAEPQLFVARQTIVFVPSGRHVFCGVLQLSNTPLVTKGNG
jgi:hypothetical protein